MDRRKILRLISVLEGRSFLDLFLLLILLSVQRFPQVLPSGLKNPEFEEEEITMIRVLSTVLSDVLTHVLLSEILQVCDCLPVEQVIPWIVFFS